MYLYAARQPILDREQNLYAYELLFRDSSGNSFPKVESDFATSKLVATSQFEYSLPQLAAGKPAHINFDLTSILKHYPSMIPVEQVVIEIADVDSPDKQLLDECIALKAAGYKILLDNYRHRKEWTHFFPYIEMIKVNTLTATTAELLQAVKIKAKHPQIKLVAGKIETNERFQLVKEMGFDFFQGYFFAQPQQIKEKSVEVSDYSLAELLFEVSHQDMEVQKIVKIFSTDVSLSYKLLRYSNSSIFDRDTEISSIKQAILSLGKEELIKFVTILFAAHEVGGKSPELLAMSLLRAKFCEGLALQYSDSTLGETAFLTGMLSLIDVILDEDMEDVVEKLKLDADVSAALLQGEGVLAGFIAVAKSYEGTNGSLLEKSAEAISLGYEEIAQAYHRAVSWSDEQMSFIIQ